MTVSHRFMGALALAFSTACMAGPSAAQPLTPEQALYLYQLQRYQQSLEQGNDGAENYGSWDQGGSNGGYRSPDGSGYPSWNRGVTDAYGGSSDNFGYVCTDSGCVSYDK